MTFTLSEPHPTVPQGTYVHSGRGGAGNYFRAPQTTPAAGVAVQVPAAAPAAPRRFYSGRGGAGNAHAAAEAPVVLNLDEEYARAQHRDHSGGCHVGRGGAGNFYKSSASTATKSASSSRRSSAESGDSARSSLWARISGSHHN